MTCRACGAEIAAKAIVCYRCGAPTAEPVSVRGPSGSRWRMPVLMVVVLVVIAVGVWLVLRAQ